MVTLQKETISDVERAVNSCDGYNFGRYNYILGNWSEGMTKEDSEQASKLLDRFNNECICKKRLSD